MYIFRLVLFILGNVKIKNKKILEIVLVFNKRIDYELW